MFEELEVSEDTDCDDDYVSDEKTSFQDLKPRRRKQYYSSFGKVLVVFIVLHSTASSKVLF